MIIIAVQQKLWPGKRLAGGTLTKVTETVALPNMEMCGYDIA